MSAPQQPLSRTQAPITPPPELEGLSLPKPAAASFESRVGAKESASTPATRDPGYFSFSSFVHSYLWSAVTFADQKAGFLFASSSAFLGYLMSDGMLRQLRYPASPWLRWIAASSLIFLVASIGLAINVVMPRLGGRSSGLIYFRAIAGRKLREHYVSDVLSSAENTLNTSLVEHSYELAKICTLKYHCLRIGIWVGLLGFIAGLVFIGLTR